jgi:hypothetical protein
LVKEENPDLSQYNLSSWLNSMVLSIAFVAFDEATDAYNKSKNGSSIKKAISMRFLVCC